MSTLTAKREIRKEYENIAKIISNAMVSLSRKSAEEGSTVGFRFTEVYDKENEELTISFLVRESDKEEITIQEFRYKILNDKSKHIQFLQVYTSILDYLLTTSLITLYNVHIQLQEDVELQDKAKNV